MKQKQPGEAVLKQSEEEQQIHGHHQHLEELQQQQQQQQHLYGRLDGESLDFHQTQTPKKRSSLPSSEQSIEYARFRERMGERNHQSSSRLGIRNTGGEIVEVQGGHIVRSTGRKDRHSKVCTAKGPRDRRVRLSALTAIQFYDVQDRLGFDRPSKAVDWLIKKAKSAIDELAELPAWHPTATPAAQPEQGQEHFRHHLDSIASSSKRLMADKPEASGYGFQHQQHLSNNPSNPSSFLPPSLDSDAIADTIKSFFPIAAAATSSSSIHFQSYPPDLHSRTSNQNQDLRLSLQSFQDPILLHPHSNPSSSSAEQAFFSGSTMGFDAMPGSWSEQQLPEMGRFQRMIAWNNGEDTGSGEGGFIFNSPPPPPPRQLQQLLSQNQFFSQRGTLQSSNSPSVRAWTDLPIATTDHHQTPAIHPPSISGIGFASGGLSGFRIPARIQGEEEQNDTVSNKLSSASSTSRH
ncbi:hypothetical protein HHK36_003560 [Tetracentron sinense]|uniref:TCP domain-containing protein n=1 Tax=Tetracentron sinense TaxID=13715 RepID=A0A834ZXZ3_TETSI|nr:hypothetical protein HHK36_003560 [Tetracentron sinense]